MPDETRRRAGAMVAAPEWAVIAGRAMARSASSVRAAPVVAERAPARRRVSWIALTMSDAHQPRLAEAHLGLGRMHVDVDVAGIAGDREGEDRVAVGRHGVGIGARAPRRAAAGPAPGGR